MKKNFRKIVENLFVFTFEPCGDESQDELEQNLALLEAYEKDLGIDLYSVKIKIKRLLILIMIGKRHLHVV